MTQPNPQKIVRLAGEGGGLDLYVFETDTGMRFSWDSIWQVPDEDGKQPTKTQGWKAAEYLSLTDAVAAAPAYWIYLAPLFVREDFQALVWKHASTQLTDSGNSSRVHNSL